MKNPLNELMQDKKINDYRELRRKSKKYDNISKVYDKIKREHSALKRSNTMLKKELKHKKSEIADLRDKLDFQLLSTSHLTLKEVKEDIEKTIRNECASEKQDLMEKIELLEIQLYNSQSQLKQALNTNDYLEKQLNNGVDKNRWSL